MLTRKQHELLSYINDYITRTGVSPSFDEMKEALDLKSKSGIHRLITGLEERGFLRRLPHRARALEVLRLPETAAVGIVQGEPARNRKFTSNVVPANFRKGMPSGRMFASATRTVELPLYGKIAAGTPIEALRDNAMIEVPPTLLGKGEHYALTVEGDSMMEAGILDGDTVVIERTDQADTGAIVVAMVEDAEVTLKRLRRKGNSIALEPANKKYETRIFRPDQVRIQGKLVGLLRKF
jgi:repressor LexA